MLKYSLKDTEKLIDVFETLSKKRNNPQELENEIIQLMDYPVSIIQEFLKCIEVLDNKDENYLRENYIGIVAYITFRLNLVK